MAEAFPDELQAICDRILHYLHTHPEAADSLEGAVAWWLPQEGLTVSREAVQRALDRLVELRSIARIPMADGRTLYQRADKASGPHPVIPAEEPD